MEKWCITQDKWINGANGEARVRSAGSTARTSGPSAGSGSNTTSLRWDRHTIQFSVNAWVFIVVVLAIFPLVPKSLSNRAYQLSFLYTLCMHYMGLRAWTLQAVQVYFQSVIATKDFVYFIYCLTFVTSHLCPKWLVLINKKTKYLEDPCVWVESNTTTLSILSSHAEIGFGWLLLVSLFSSVADIFCLFLLLKLMYHALVSTGYHQSVWAKIGRTINPFILCYAPFLIILSISKGKVIDYIHKF
ncbi:hypothetical protein E1A91_A03G116800v1 [Gossypium mustelinum]|uniref:Uncharacterized protein n=1 Tax=Gossypium mustelinum TaxID=34275 RepID=A0A5D2ZVN1_GOSMU|nr:hypothetical protein E1A91_A03G116800v1 [Gossypium mustelinum]